jgi:hypothetical protein
MERYEKRPTVKGASGDHVMTHLSITTGSPTWGDHVTDAEYSA